MSTVIDLLSGFPGTKVNSVEPMFPPSRVPPQISCRILSVVACCGLSPGILLPALTRVTWIGRFRITANDVATLIV
jgi:hypothetical protein